MTTPRIRPATPADEAQIARVCLLTGADGGDAAGRFGDDTVLADVFALPYLHGPSCFAWVVDVGGEVRGYVKPLFTDLSLRAADRDDVTDRIWTRLAAAVLAVLENPRTEQVAARIPLDGPLEDPDVGLLATVLSLLRNAAVRAFEPQLEHTVRLRGEE